MKIVEPYSGYLSTLESRRPLYANNRLNPLPTYQGIYAFWWKNEDKSVIHGANRKLSLKGRKIGKKSTYSGPEIHGHERHNICWNWGLEDDWICLYVGKSTHISNRIVKHLTRSVSSKDWYDNKGKKSPELGFVYKINSECQFRAGIEHLDLGEKGIKSNVYLSSVEISGVNDSVATRFYMEDLAIGVLKPWFNVDSER
jgi:hypothetical protein